MKHVWCRIGGPGFEFCPCVPITSPSHYVTLGRFLNHSVYLFICKMGEHNILLNWRHSINTHREKKHQDLQQKYGLGWKVLVGLITFESLAGLPFRFRERAKVLLCPGEAPFLPSTSPPTTLPLTLSPNLSHSDSRIDFETLQRWPPYPLFPRCPCA